MYTVKRQCSGALKLLQSANPASASPLNQSLSQFQELSVFRFNRDQIQQKNAYSTKPIHKPIKKLMVANRGKPVWSWMF